MSIKLKRVELSNFRTHDHLVFSPENDGITAISGPNGSGKSTIVDSVVWALYGVKPQGVSKNSDLTKSDVKLEKNGEEAFVIVNIVIDGRELKIKRFFTDGGKHVQCTVSEVGIDDKGVAYEKKEAGDAVSDAELYIRQFMKMDKKGFLAAILVQQKQVDNLIAAGSKERAQVIEKLIGVSSITKALDSAREHSRELKKEFDYIDVNEEDFEKLKKEKEKSDKDFEKNQKLHTDLKIKLKEIIEKTKESREKLNSETSKINSVEELNQTVVTLQAQIKAQEETLEAVIVEKNNKKEQLSRAEAGASIDELEPQVQEHRRKIRQLENEKSSMQKDLDEAKKELKNAQDLIEKSSIKTTEEAESGLAKKEAQLTAMLNKLNNSRAEILSSDSEVKKLDKAISVLSNGDGTCPTCLQHVEDVSDAIKVLNSQKDELLRKKEEEKVNVETYENNIEKVNQIIEKFNQLIEAINIDEVLAESIAEDEKEIQKHSSMIKVSESEYAAFDKVYQAAKRKSETKEEYDRLLSRSKNISNDINTKNKELEDAQKAIKESGVISSSALEKLRKSFDEYSAKYNDIREKEGNVRVDLNVSIERSKNLEEKVNEYKKRLDLHSELVKTYEISTTTTKVLEEFRSDRIDNSIPVIEVYASDLLNRFTDGMFTRLKIDSKFNTKVVRSDGREVAVGLLSGGELSATAIALRLSISMLLNGGGSENLIILDEVLVSQDDNRASLILSTIKEVCKGQVILVAHNSVTDEISDKVFDLR